METSDVVIRDMEKGEEFAEWFADLLLRHDEETGLDSHRDDRYLVLSNEIGDWIGGLRWSLRGGVASVIEVGVLTYASVASILKHRLDQSAPPQVADGAPPRATSQALLPEPFDASRTRRNAHRSR